jgi:hypothetical protein
MPFQTNSKIDIPNFTHRLISNYPGENATSGTGFIVDFNNSTWLFTCWHNIELCESSQTVLTGKVMAETISFVGGKPVTLNLRERRIVGCRVNGLRADIVAIELNPAEKPAPPYFLGKSYMNIEGVDFPKVFELQGPAGGEGLNVSITKHYLWQGYPGGNMSSGPVTYRAFDFPGSKSQHPWMLRYSPGGYPGASGCPIIELNQEKQAMRIAGVHVHIIKVSKQHFDGHSTLDGSSKTAISNFEWGAAVPVELLYVAIEDSAANGVSIIDLTVQP